MKRSISILGAACLVVAVFAATSFVSQAGTIDTYDDKRPPEPEPPPPPETMSLTFGGAPVYYAAGEEFLDGTAALISFETQINQQWDYLSERRSITAYNDRLTVFHDDESEVGSLSLQYTAARVHCVKLLLPVSGLIAKIYPWPEEQVANTGSVISVTVNEDFSRQARIDAYPGVTEPEAIMNALVGILQQKTYVVSFSYPGPIVITKDNLNPVPITQIRFCSGDPNVISGHIELVPQ